MPDFIGNHLGPTTGFFRRIGTSRINWRAKPLKEFVEAMLNLLQNFLLRTSRPAGASVRTVLALAFWLFAVGSATGADRLDVISPESLEPHLNYLASPDRRGRDDWGKIESRDYIISHFKSLGIKPLFSEGYIQAIPKFGDASRDAEIMGQNVAAFVEGTDPQLKDEWIVVNAHYDHLGVKQGRVYPGADDNASGVAMLLEVARYFSRLPARRSIAFVAFDLEEHLLWGSRWFLAHCPVEPEQIKFCLTADMIGRSLGGLDLPTVFVMGCERSPDVRRALDEAIIPAELEVARLGIDIVGSRSDYSPFFLRRIPFLFFSTGEHPDYHTPRDTLERLNVPKAARISTVINRVVRNVANQPAEIRWDGKNQPGIEEVTAVNLVTQRVLAAHDAGEFALSDLQQVFISQLNTITAAMMTRPRITSEERKWLVRSTQIMMLSTF